MLSWTRYSCSGLFLFLAFAQYPDDERDLSSMRTIAAGAVAAALLHAAGAGAQPRIASQLEWHAACSVQACGVRLVWRVVCWVCASSRVSACSVSGPGQGHLPHHPLLRSVASNGLPVHLRLTACLPRCRCLRANACGAPRWGPEVPVCVPAAESASPACGARRAVADAGGVKGLRDLAVAAD